MQLFGKLTEIYSGAVNSTTSRWVPTSFQDKLVVASPGAPLVYWPGAGRCRPVPGLPDSSGWDGVTDINGILVLWNGTSLKWCAANDLSLWIPLSVAATVGRATLDGAATQPAVGTASGWWYLRSVSGSFTPEEYVRVVSYEDDATRISYDYYTVAYVGAASYKSSSIVSQSLAAGATDVLFVSGYVAWPEGVRLKLAGSSSALVTASARSREVEYSYGIAADSPAKGVELGVTIQVLLTEAPSLARVGDYVSLGSAGADVFLVTAQAGLSITLVRVRAGTAPTPVGVRYSGSLVHQHYVGVTNTSSVTVACARDATVAVQDALKLAPLGLTGATPAGGTLPDGAVVETVPVNEAGELANVGSAVAGRIFGVTTVGDYGYILKERSIQSLQPVASTAGTFFPRLEVPDEGPVGRYAWVRAAERGVYFWGHKGWYVYTGGPQLTPFGVWNWAEINAKLDRSRADEIIAYHHEAEKSIWFVYPAVDRTWRVVVYNYLEDTLTEDAYPEDVEGITAVGAIDWEIGDTWESLPTTELWTTRDKRWSEYVEEAEKRYTLMGVGGVAGSLADGELATSTVPRLLVHGRDFSRAFSDPCDPQAYRCFAETPDFDFGDPAVWKYVDTVQLGVVAEAPKDPPSRLSVEVGVKASLDDPITWCGPAFVDVTGGLNTGATRVNIRAAGRFVRLRVSSHQAFVHWRLSWYRIVARAGGTR